MRTITREEGPLALYKGAVPALMLCGQGAVQFAAYEWLKARVPKQDDNVRLIVLTAPLPLSAVGAHRC